MTLVVAIEISTSGSTLYVASHGYTSRSTDTPASTYFLPRIISDVEFTRRVGTFFWQEQPRGSQGFGVIDIANNDGTMDTYAGNSLRDKTVRIKRGEHTSAYSAFTTVAVLIVDRVEFTDERIMRIYTKDLSAKLERPLQSNLYPTTLSNGVLRGRPRPVTIGRCYQVPLLQPDLTGNGHYDVHDNNNWIGIEQYMDQGIPILAYDSPSTTGTGYRRSNKSGIYGAERTSSVAGKQVATVFGAFKYQFTWISEDFANLTNFTEANGGVANRDASIVSNRLRMLNTAGGANLTLTHNQALVPAGGLQAHFFYEFDCTSVTSGYVNFEMSGIATLKKIDAVGHYSGVTHYRSSFSVVFNAPNGSNADVQLDTFRVYTVEPIERLPDVIKYVATNDANSSGKGPLGVGEFDFTAINALDAAAPYYLGFHASDPVMIPDVLDQVMVSYGGWWYVNRLGQITAGRLVAPSGTAAYAFTQANIAEGMKVTFDEAKGLSNLILAKRNWMPYEESEIASSLNYVQLNPSDKDADVTLLGSNYAYSVGALGAVRSMPSVFGDRVYFEVRIATTSAAQHYIGFGNAQANIASVPGIDAHAIAYRSDGVGNGLVRQNSTSIESGLSGYTVGDIIGVAMDLRPAARGEAASAVWVYFSKNGVWEIPGSGSDPNMDIPTTVSLPNVTFNYGYVMIGGASAGQSGDVNFGQTAFAYGPPNDYVPPAWHRTIICQKFRYSYESTVALHASYTHADATGKEDAGIPTLLSKEANARTECDRWATLYSQERFFYEFDAFMDATSADQLDPGTIISVTYPRFGLSAGKLLTVIGVTGRLLDNRVTIRAWG